MKNLAGDSDCNNTIVKELTKSNAELVPNIYSTGEVPYSIIGKVGEWKLTRAWCYWVASTEGKGLPIHIASEMHEKKYPNHMFDDCETLVYGEVIRSRGHAGAPHPKEYGSELLTEDGISVVLDVDGKIEQSYMKLSEQMIINIKKSMIFVKEILPEHKEYVNSYHIDSQEGLNEFIRVVKKL